MVDIKIDKNYCLKELVIGLKHFKDQDPNGIYDMGSGRSKLTNQARGDNLSNCYKILGGPTKVSSTIRDINNGDIDIDIGDEVWHGGATINPIASDPRGGDETGDERAITTTAVTNGNGFWENEIVAQGMYYVKTGFWIILVCFGIYFFYRLYRYIIAFLYDVLSVHRLIYLKVILPRGDSKIDREREKELAKDMKEKISRMSQVYRNIHKLGDLGLKDTLMKFLFDKPKISLMMHYEKGLLSFIIGVYPEYRKIIEGAIAAQYSESSIEQTLSPKYFTKKYSDIVPMQPTKDVVYPIRIFKQLEDDPINNVIDGIGKISSEDVFTVQLIIKPQGEGFNKKAKRFSDALYKNDDAAIRKTPLRKKLLMPWKFFDFLIHGPSEELMSKFGKNKPQDGYVRMVKAEEDALNTMGEEAGKPGFTAGLMLMSSSDNKDRLNSNMNNVMSAFSVYKDEYNNALDEPRILSDIFGAFLVPVWKFAAMFQLPNFFYRKNIFTINEISSIFHFPDGTYNRSPVIKWMDYKVLPPPDNLQEFKDDSGFRLTGIIAEEYKKGVISEIFKGKRHRAVGEKEEDKEILEPIEGFKENELEDKEIVEKDGKKFVKTMKKIKKTALKVFRDGVFLGINVYRNKFSPVYMGRDERTRHHYIIGKSGGGKSVYIASLARQDVWNGDGICVIDPHGDLCEDIIEFVPKERARDVIYFDAGNENRPMGLNLYEIDNIDQADRTVNDATEIFLKMFGSEIFGPRIQEYFKYGSLTLLEDMDEGATLLDVPRLFTDEVYREYKIKKVKNPVVRNFWEKTYNAMGDREKQEIIPYFTSKFVSFNTNRLIRNIIGQTKSAVRFRQAMDSGKIVLVNLSKGKIGELNAQLLGMIFVSQIYNAAMSRANVPQSERRDFYLYVDEFQNFVSGTFADILSEARKYRLGLIMAHQYIAQLESGNKSEGGKASVKDAVFGNVGTMQSFKVGAPDAEFLEKEYAPVLSAQDIVGISNYKVYIKLNINNATSRVFSMNAIYTNDYQNKKVAEVLKEYSAKKYGRKREFVDAEITARLGMLDSFDDAELGDDMNGEMPPVEGQGVPQEQVQAE